MHMGSRICTDSGHCCVRICVSRLFVCFKNTLDRCSSKVPLVERTIRSITDSSALICQNDSCQNHSNNNGVWLVFFPLKLSILINYPQHGYSIILSQLDYLEIFLTLTNSMCHLQQGHPPPPWPDSSVTLPESTATKIHYLPLWLLPTIFPIKNHTHGQTPHYSYSHPTWWFTNISNSLQAVSTSEFEIQRLCLVDISFCLCSTWHWSSGLEV